MPKHRRKEKKVVNLQPQYTLSKEQLQAPKRKRPKNAPDKPQPAWMFPPDEENPVLNPKSKTAQELENEKKEKAASMDFLHHKSVGAPMRPAPPQLLVSLVGSYLTSYGFDGASRLYTTQLSARKKLDDWKITVDYPIPKGTPNLVQIFKQWHKDFELREDPSETSSSDSDDSLDTKVRKTNSKASKAALKATTGDDTSSSGESEEEDATSEESGSDVDMKDASPPPKKATKAKKVKERKKTKATKKAKNRSTPSTSTSATSDSEADDELEYSGAALPKTNKAPAPVVNTNFAESSSDSSSNSEAEPEPPTAPAVLTKSSKVSSSDSSSDESDEPKAPLTTNTVITETTTIKAPSSSSDSSSSDSSDSEAERLPAQTTTTTTTTSIINPKQNRGSDSSETLVATTPTTTATTAIAPASSESSSTSSSDSEEEPPPNKRKRSLSPVPGSTKMLKKSNTPFQRVPSSTKVDERFKSNAYQPYDYANRAHQDLVVTKGRGFTKEKNKKKRGTYRGGAIDVNEGGGKGIRFD